MVAQPTVSTISNHHINFHHKNRSDKQCNLHFCWAHTYFVHRTSEIPWALWCIVCRNVASIRLYLYMFTYFPFFKRPVILEHRGKLSSSGKNAIYDSIFNDVCSSQSLAYSLTHLFVCHMFLPSTPSATFLIIFCIV